jgi:hypothetical protein
MSKVLHQTGTFPETSERQTVTFNNLVKVPCPTNSLQFPLGFSMMKIFCANENLGFNVVQNCDCGTSPVWYIDGFPADY